MNDTIHCPTYVFSLSTMFSKAAFVSPLQLRKGLSVVKIPFALELRGLGATVLFISTRSAENLPDVKLLFAFNEECGCVISVSEFGDSLSP